jgi:hypothetical protein
MGKPRDQRLMSAFQVMNGLRSDRFGAVLATRWTPE